jgi:hypothetical protein
MEELDPVTIASAVGVAAYMAIATGSVAHYNLGLSLQEVRGAAVAIAVVIATAIDVDFVSNELHK